MSQLVCAKECHEHLLTVARSLSPALTNAIKQNGILTLSPQAKTPFAERLCRAVAGQQLSVKAAASIWGRVVASKPDEMDLMTHLHGVEPAVLKGCGLSGAKVKAMGAIAQASQFGQLNATDLQQLSTVERTQRLTALWGIGQWTADMMNLFYFGEPDIWPEGDVTARNTLETLTSKRRKTIRTAERFGPYRSYLALHMWRHVDATPDNTPDNTPDKSPDK